MSKTMSIQVRKCQVRNKPSFLGKVVATLDYADQVTVRREQEDWYEVAAFGKKGNGWVHVSALSTKKIVLNPDSSDIQAGTSSDEIALAGKGFNEQVEKNFRKKNKNVDFTWIDKMEKIVVSQQEIQGFLTKGGLQVEGGAA
ncbi:MAG: SH3 domain-containing protein [Desulfobulbaceae bacterium]